jgi:ATP-dependent helicase/nuclease subunit A
MKTPAKSLPTMEPRMVELIHTAAPDVLERQRALDITRSCIVQAPAGSGKTELLTTRFLRLLAVVEQPEEILAITFTRAATAEMRSRILGKLEAARRNEPTGDEDVCAHALAALSHSERRGWHLLDQPHRLNIQTIDSLCLRIAHSKPLLSRLGGALQPTENAGPLYQLAARRTLQQLGGARTQLSESLSVLLNLRDNQLADCERLIAGMLANRDQWAHAFPLAGHVDWDEVRAQLEAPFQRAIGRTLSEAHNLLSSQPVLVDELLSLANHACQGVDLNIDIGLLSGISSLPPASLEFVKHWDCLCEFLLTRDNEFRKSYNRKYGFAPSPGGDKNSFEKQQKDRITSLLERFRGVPRLLESLGEVRHLPPPRYTDQQWQLVRHFFNALVHATAELHVVFAETDSVDFVELGMSATAVLNADADVPTDLALALSERISHLLVDEFQDTSRQQHRLLSLLVRGWNPGDGRTCFLVGDPMQSIYMFRQAEVELFNEVRDRGLGDQDLSLDPVTLTANFRSHAGLVNPLNELFPLIFDTDAHTGAGDVRFNPSEAIEPALTEKSFVPHPLFAGSEDRKPTKEDTVEAREREADAILDILKQHLQRIEQARLDSREYRVAVLTRAKSHVALIAQRLRAAAIPFRAVELETLGERQEIRDLLSLARALLHPMDRVAWLSVLRAPWCGLTLTDLHRLCGSDDDNFRRAPLFELLATRISLLSEEGRTRATRTFTVLRHSLAVRYQESSFAAWMERTWNALGGPHCLDAAGYENAQVFFRMLDAIPMDGIACLGDLFDEQLSKLFAQPDPHASERQGIQLLTVHKAKGLGFDVVIVPGLERGSAFDAPPLICWLQRPISFTPCEVSHHQPEKDEILVAPVGPKGERSEPLYQWVRRQKSQREAEERKRLLYVACTRARRELHLFGTVTVSHAGPDEPRAGSLLATAWPALERLFEDSWAEHKQKTYPMPAVEVAEELQMTLDLAAGAETSVKPRLTLRRLPAGSMRHTPGIIATDTATLPPIINPPADRPHGSRISQAVGTAIHALLERITLRLATESKESLLSALNTWRPVASTLLQSNGGLPAEIDASADSVLKAVEDTLTDPTGLWIMSTHSWGQAESSWTGWHDGALRTLRADRIFRAGTEPLSEGNDCIWIVDYKTSEARHSTTNSDGTRQEEVEPFFAEQRAIYEPQLSTYAEVMRLQSGGETPVRLGLYFPRMRRLHSWTAGE